MQYPTGWKAGKNGAYLGRIEPDDFCFGFNGDVSQKKADSNKWPCAWSIFHPRQQQLQTNVNKTTFLLWIMRVQNNWNQNA